MERRRALCSRPGLSATARDGHANPGVGPGGWPLTRTSVSRGHQPAPNGEWLTAGGRVLGVTSPGDTLAEALNRCYEAAGDISWEGMQYRRDIGRG